MVVCPARLQTGERGAGRVGSSLASKESVVDYNFAIDSVRLAHVGPHWPEARVALERARIPVRAITLVCTGISVRMWDSATTRAFFCFCCQWLLDWLLQWHVRGVVWQRVGHSHIQKYHH